ncbi:MAG: WD40/YVTN/BNR-like repeat-containing protein [Myxococcota bacterium]
MIHARSGFIATVFTAFLVTQVGCHVMDFTPRYAEGEIDIYDDLFAVSVIDDQRVVAAGYHGTVYWTNDGGDTWHKGATDTERLIYSMSMGSATHGWAVGQSGTVLRTEDGGRTWRTQPNLKVDEGSHLFGVHAIDANTAWAVGEWGTRIHTTDGGATWVDRSIPITLSHPQFVWLSISEQDKVRRGEMVYEDVGLNNVYCRPKPSTRCWIVGEFGYIFYSDDQGETWERGSILGDVRVDPIKPGFDEIELPEANIENLGEFAKVIADANHLNVLIDPYISEAELAKYGDPDDPSEIFDLISARIDETRSVLEEAGVLFDRLRMPDKPPWDYEDFLEDDPEFLNRYISGRVADEALINVSVIQNPFLFTVNFVDDDRGLISGLGGVILRTEDGGRTWAYEDSGWKQAFFSVTTTTKRAIAIGEKGLIRFSTDGGITWSPPSSESFPTIFTFMRDLGFDQTEETGFIVGQEGMVLRSKDGGSHWSQVLPPPDAGKARS